MVTLNASMSMHNDSECQTEEDDGSKCQIEDMALNAKLWRDSGSGRLKLEKMSGSECLKLMKEMALNA